MLVKTSAKFGQSYLTAIVLNQVSLIEASKNGIKAGDDVFAVMVARESNPFRNGVAKCDIYDLQGNRLIRGAPLEWAGFYAEYDSRNKWWEFFIKCGTPCDMPVVTRV